MSSKVWVIIGNSKVVEASEAMVVQVDKSVLDKYYLGKLYEEEVQEKAERSYSANEMIENMEFKN